jgi:hypothetical protein
LLVAVIDQEDDPAVAATIINSGEKDILTEVIKAGGPETLTTVMENAEKPNEMLEIVLEESAPEDIAKVFADVDSDVLGDAIAN